MNVSRHGNFKTSKISVRRAQDRQPEIHDTYVPAHRPRSPPMGGDGGDDSDERLSKGGSNDDGTVGGLDESVGGWRGLLEGVG